MVSKKPYWLLLIGLLFFLTVIPKNNARADVGVPPAHPGSSLSPGDYETNVQMVSEKVEIIINEEPYKASVAASFQMRNTSAEDEEIEVWFPLGERKNYAKKERVIQVTDFQAWVGDEPKEITIEKSDEWNLVWAHWPVSFPAETPVEIRVSYILSPAWDISPSDGGRFDYILETGAGWQGLIEKAEITIQAPYALGELDTLLGFGDAFYANPSGYSLDHGKIRWMFNDLEPTPEDNIKLSLLKPETWRSIYNSYETVATSPSDWEAYETLARGLSRWYSTQASAEYHGFTETTLDVTSIVELVGDSWKKVLELSPPDPVRYESALRFFRWNPEVIEPYQIQNYFNEAMELFPENEEIRFEYDQTLSEGLIKEGGASISPTPPPATATTIPAGPAESDIDLDSPTTTPSVPFSLIMGIGFIGTAVVLIIIAVKRREIS